MTGHDRQRAVDIAIGDVKISAAHAASSDHKTQLAGAGFGQRAFDLPQALVRRIELHGAHGRGHVEYPIRFMAQASTASGGPAAATRLQPSSLPIL